MSNPNDITLKEISLSNISNRKSRSSLERKNYVISDRPSQQLEKLEKVSDSSISQRCVSDANDDSPVRNISANLNSRTTRQGGDNDEVDEARNYMWDKKKEDYRNGLQDKNIKINRVEDLVQDALEMISDVVVEVEVLRQEVENFSGSSNDDRDFVYLEEMLVRNTVKLDNVESYGSSLVKQERKKAVHHVQKLLKILDARLKDNRARVKYEKRRKDESDDD